VPVLLFSSRRATGARRPAPWPGPLAGRAAYRRLARRRALRRLDPTFRLRLDRVLPTL